MPRQHTVWAYNAIEPCDLRLPPRIEERRAREAFDCKVPWLKHLGEFVLGFMCKVSGHIERQAHRLLLMSSGPQVPCTVAEMKLRYLCVTSTKVRLVTPCSRDAIWGPLGQAIRCSVQLVQS
ncbi:hypothetical protein IscW_ISCW007412 [Ixodes scapularis]|uniref:Uncharacterized protein n=1 Tax=Ixodes scapularis TaxID=6945 RepID=B7PRZ5_IXOSC|nr:hypothetical protein IscW_ISCW007412 [Ixodes scapularis]|eukprot:XP_002401474.1 hypothetical protein IscW_ISCW007412 [Ixodes scapularis]